jgi:hypothetical protein
VVDGKHFLVNLRSVDVAEKQSIAVRSARVRLGVKDIGFGAVQKIQKTTGSIITVMVIAVLRRERLVTGVPLR